MRLCYDIETDGLLNLKITKTKKLELPGTKIHCVAAEDIDTGEKWAFGPDEIDKACELLSAADTLVGHNIIRFDNPMVHKITGLDLSSKTIIDTLVAGCLMFPDSKNLPTGLANHSLDSWASFSGSHKIHYTGGWEAFSQEMMDYCQQDVAGNVAVYHRQWEWIAAHEQLLAFEQKVTGICLEMSLNGFTFDRDKAEPVLQGWLIQQADLVDQLRRHFPDIVTTGRTHKTTGRPLKDLVEVFNPGSNPMWVSRLKDKYGYKPVINEKTDNPIFDNAIKTSLKDTYEEIALGLEYDHIDKRITMLEKWILRADNTGGLVQGNTNPQGAVTGRASHSQENLAQVPKTQECRSLFSSCVPGWVMVGCDLSGIEARCLAHYTYKWDKGTYAQEILSGDIHTMNQKAADLPTRDAAKTFIYALLYGAGDKKIGSIVNGTEYHGRKIKEKFFSKMPALRHLNDAVRLKAKTTGKLKLLDGRQVPIRAENAALNTLLQGAGAIISKYWLVNAERNLEGLPYKLMAWVHDELQVCCPAEYADQIGQILVDSAAEAGRQLNFNMPVDAEYKVGNNWWETH